MDKLLDNDSLDNDSIIAENKTEKKNQILIVLFFVLIFFKNYVSEDNTFSQILLNASYILIGIITTMYYLVRLERNSLIFITIALMTLFSIVTSLFGENYRIEDNVLVLTYFGVSFLILNTKFNFKLSVVLMYLIFFFFGIQMFSAIDPNEIFNISRNFISVVLLWGVSFHIISSYKNDKKPSIIIIILSLIVSIWATGRGGIIVFSVLLVFFPFVIETSKFYKFLIIVLVVALATYAFNNFYDLLFDFGLGRFEGMELESDRSSINGDYINNILMSFYDFTFGANLMEIPSIIEVDGNPHNSFIRLHVYYGIFGVVLIMSLLSYTVYRLFVTKKYLYLLLLIVLLLRSYVDSTAFHGPFDPFIYFFIFSCIKDINIVHKCPNNFQKMK